MAVAGAARCSRRAAAAGLLAGACLAWGAATAAAAAAAGRGNVFQDEVRAAAAATSGGSGSRGGVSNSGSNGMQARRTTTTADFQDAAWQAGYAREASASSALYREPFALATDADMHAYIDLAYDFVAAQWKTVDVNHNGILHNTDVRLCVLPALLFFIHTCWSSPYPTTPNPRPTCSIMTKVLNPDSAPLSTQEAQTLDQMLGVYLRKQGLEVPGLDDPRRVTREFLHGWPTIFFLRDATTTLRDLRAEALLEAAAARAATARANANVRVDVGSDGSAAGDEEHDGGDALRRLTGIAGTAAADAYLAAARH